MHTLVGRQDKRQPLKARDASRGRAGSPTRGGARDGSALGFAIGDLDGTLIRVLRTLVSSSSRRAPSPRGRRTARQRETALRTTAVSRISRLYACACVRVRVSRIGLAFAVSRHVSQPRAGRTATIVDARPKERACPRPVPTVSCQITTTAFLTTRTRGAGRGGGGQRSSPLATSPYMHLLESYMASVRKQIEGRRCE